MNPSELETFFWECRGCNANVFTAYSKHGNRMTVDAVPNDAGNLAITKEQLPGEFKPFLVALVYQKPMQEETLFEVDENRPEHLYLDHHVVCPMASEFKR